MANKKMRKPSVHKKLTSHGTNVETPSTEREKIIRKSYVLTKQDIGYIEHIKDICLNQKVVLNDSHVIRIALSLASRLSEDKLIQASHEVPRLITGRPKKK